MEHESYIVVNIGCLECIKDSFIMGVFDTQKEAETFAKHEYKQHKQRYFQVRDDDWRLNTKNFYRPQYTQNQIRIFKWTK